MVVIIIVELWLVCAASLAPLIIFGSRSRVVIWAYPHPFHSMEKVGPMKPKITSLSYGEW